MKKIILIFICLLFTFAHAEVLKGSVNESIIPEGFWGTWGVISKLKASNNPSLFNLESKDVWVLSGYSNILVLENLQSGAKSEIKVEKSRKKDNLKFGREKVVENGSEKTVYKETVELLIIGNSFTGNDNFIIENYKDGKLVKKSEAFYALSAIKISGTNPK